MIQRLLHLVGRSCGQLAVMAERRKASRSALLEIKGWLEQAIKLIDEFLEANTK